MTFVKRSLRAAVLLTPFFLSACAIPTYQPGASEKVAHVRLMGLGQLTMCRDHLVHFLPVHEDEKGARWTYIPAGERVELANYTSLLEGTGTVACTARITVVPREGIKLIVNATTPAFNSCGLEIVREDDSTETGLSVEPSLMPSRLPNRQPGLNGPSC